MSQGNDNFGTLINKISGLILDKQPRLKKLINIKNSSWLPLPSPSRNKNITIGTVDGGSRMESRRGLQIYYAQGAGRIVSYESNHNSNWITRQDGGVVLQGKLALDTVKIIREILEVEIANDLIVNSKPDYILLDGTLKGLFVIDRTMTSFLKRSLSSRNQLNEEIELFRISLTTYGIALSEMLSNAREFNTTLVGLTKDSYAQDMISEDLREVGISDASFFSLLSNNKAGRSDLDEFPQSSQIDLAKLIPSIIRNFWLDENIILPNKYLVKSFYTMITDNSQPIRIDFHSHGKNDPDRILSDLLNFSDGRDWFIPPRLSHEKAVVKNDLFNSFIKQIYQRVGSKNPEIAKLLLGETRRVRTQ